MANPRTIAKLAARIHERAAHAIEFELKDPRSAFITVTRVELSSDLSSAKIFYSVLGGAGEKSKAAHMLESATGFIQRQVARVLDVRRVPRLGFVYDDSIEQASHLSEVIQKALERDKVIAEQGQPPPEPADEEWQEEYETFKEGQPPPPGPSDAPRT